MARHLVLLSLFGLTACPGNLTPSDGGDPDGSVVTPPDDAGSDGGLPDAGFHRVDWRAQRGAPYDVAARRVYDGGLFAIFPASDVTRSGCDAEGRCDYAWHGLDGGPTASLQALSPFAGSGLSPDGRLFAAQQQAVIEVCGSSVVATGTLRLLELETGAARLETPAFRSNLFREPPFSEYGRWLVTFPIAPGQCAPVEQTHRSLVPPFARALGESAAVFLIRELADGRMLADDPTRVGVLDPATGVFDPLVSDATSVEANHGFVHALLRAPIRQVASWQLSTDRKTTWDLPWQQTDFVRVEAHGRWVAACGLVVPGRERSCLLHDALGEVADRPQRVGGPGASMPTLAGAAHFAVLHEPDAGSAVRLDLLTGARETLPPAEPVSTTVGEGAAVLMQKGRDVWLVERDRVELLANDVQALVTIDGPERATGLPQRQLAVLIRVSASGGENRLSVYHHATHRLTELTDSLYFHEEFRTPLTETDTCGVPWVARSAGPAGESTRQPAGFLYFGELLPAEGVVDLYLLPLDLSAPPRKLGRFERSACPAPKVSADGSTVAFDRPLADGRSELWRGGLR